MVFEWYLNVFNDILYSVYRLVVSNGILNYRWEYHWVLLKYHWMVQRYSMVFNGIPLALFYKGMYGKSASPPGHLYSPSDSSTFASFAHILALLTHYLSVSLSSLLSLSISLLVSTLGRCCLFVFSTLMSQIYYIIYLESSYHCNEITNYYWR